MKVLVINAGSSSLKFTLYSMETEKQLASGQIERLGLERTNLIYKRSDGLKIERPSTVKNHTEALNDVCNVLTDPESGVLKDNSEVEAIGHRVVHGGEKITEPVIIDEKVKKIICDCFSLAPLHNPPNMAGIEACEELFPGTANVAVFDTAFHQTMAPEAYLYAVPYDLYTDYAIRRYGFHGTSHHFVALASAQLLGRPLEELNLITCHLGNGCSMAAIKKGKVQDTTMGMTPLEGLVMGTRCGDIDPAIVVHLQKLGRSAAEVDTLLNKKSGLLGVAGIGSSDMRDIISESEQGNERALRARLMFTRRIVKYIGAYFTLLDGADAVVFTGGIGEYSLAIRQDIVEKLGALNLHLDKDKNSEYCGKPGIISTESSAWKAMVMPTDEEKMIARNVVRILGAS